MRPQLSQEAKIKPNLQNREEQKPSTLGTDNAAPDQKLKEEENRGNSQEGTGNASP